MTHPFKEAVLTPTEKQAMEVARVGFMAACPFYAHLFYAECREVFTTDVPTAATDGRHIFINPTYVAGLKPAERVFVYAHEMDHVLCRDVQRLHNYEKAGGLKGKPWDQQTWNQATDYRINAGLIEQGVGLMNPDWLFDPRFTQDDLPEDIYERIHKAKPPGGAGGPGAGSTYGGSGKAPKGAKGDPTAKANGGGFDGLLPPPIDDSTGRVDLPDDATFKEAVARAASAAKAMGKMPGSLQRKIDQILEHQVDWRDHIRLVMTGIFGSRGECWEKVDRRQNALNAMFVASGRDGFNPFSVVLPGKKGYGCDTVIVARDTSGSVSEAELSAYNAEVGGILADVRPRKIIVIDCDARIQKVQEVHDVEEAGNTLHKAHGGGGTSFRPVFTWIEEQQIKPEAVIYCTDMMGSFPSADPGYPVVWAATTDAKAPFGETIRLKVK